MLKYLKDEANTTYTENGAVTNRTSFSDCVDLFGTIGALRHADDNEIINRFIRAYTENPDVATKILFFARDVRGGLGERKAFRTILKWLADNKPATVRKNILAVAEYGRWDDLLVLLNTKCRANAIKVIKDQLQADIKAKADNGGVSLLAKWLPSVNASNPETVAKAKDLARALGMREAEYRKTLSDLRAYIKIIENNLREQDYSFDYSKQPSKAMYKYRKAFIRNDGERYTDFLNRVNSGEATMHAGTLMPYELVESCLKNRRWWVREPLQTSEEEALAINTTWAAMPDFGNGENALAVIDTSGSMYGGCDPTPASVALSLGMYFAEHSKGAFANHFIEFSARPQLIEMKGETFLDKLSYLLTFNEVANTNIEAVFDLILTTAVKHGLPQSELPAKLYLISDMEFDYCVSNARLSNFENARRKFKAHGYKLPDIVFWNVNSRNRQQPVTVNDEGVALVSGCNPRIFSMVMEGVLNPYDYMMSVIDTERYAGIAA